MNLDLRDNSWMQCGSSLLWDATALNLICPSDSVCSLREFLRLHQSDWTEADLKLINGRVLVVAGLDAALDSLDADNAVEWLENTVYAAILGFQEQVADGGREAALIFWLADGRRVFHQAAESTYHWHCSGEHRRKSIPIGRCIWNGAESSARRIVRSGADKKETHVGLFLQRIS
jgi:hypothetical protein